MFKMSRDEIMENMGSIIIWGLIIVGVVFGLIWGLTNNLNDTFNNINLFSNSVKLFNSITLFSGGNLFNS
ncbi:hypothetical protein ACFSR7_06145 [Cohnella sp. GCM10020058]|uniref:hypothetical protein n=1 Tax=Cohnella sp. GCM10020058 TaxID=3317330 RepID=UPI003637F61D